MNTGQTLNSCPTQPELRSAVTLSLNEGTSIEVSSTAEDYVYEYKLSERHFKLNAQTGRNWLQQGY